MARYPTFEEYQKRGNFKDGIQRCDELLAKNPNDVQLLVVKFQLTLASNNDADPILDQLLSIQTPLDVRELLPIEEAIVESFQDVHPRPQTTGPAMATLWDKTIKASEPMNRKLDLISLRFSRAVEHNRLVDAHQALIQLKAAQPKNRAFYMAHAIVTQMLSTSKEDLQSRLALSLARKAVSENFDDDKSLDCRVPGQIFALQESIKDLESIAGRPFKETKQVYDALRKASLAEVNGVPVPPLSKSSPTVPPAEWLTQEVQTLKEQFAQLIQVSANMEAISTFAVNSIRLFHTAISLTPDGRGRGLADASFVSISALVRMFELSDDSKYLLYSAFLAEQLLEQNTHVHETRLILVYLYMRLGMGSLALSMFESLHVKEIQYDTVGHALLTRLSFTHPFDTNPKKKEATNPIKRTSNALAVYTRCEEKLAETEMNVLNNGQTGMILDLQELRDNLRLSLTRRIVHLEQRRLWRLVHGTNLGELTEMGPRVTANWIDTTDSRDFAATFDYGYNVEKVLHGINGAVPGKYWILYGLASESAWCMAMGFPTPVKDVERLLKELQTVVRDFGERQAGSGGASVPGMSNAEVLAGELACRVLELFQHSSAGDDEMTNDVEAVLTAVERLNVDALVKTTTSHADRLADHYVFLDILRIVIKASDVAEGKSNDCKEKLQNLQKISKGYFSAIQTRAKPQIAQIKADNIKMIFEGGDAISEVIGLFGGRNIEGFCKSIALSAWDGWGMLTWIKLV